MSASANTSSIHQTAKALRTNEAMPSIESIGTSVTARIDYNLRFSKQVVLVVGNDSEQYSSLASQFLVSLSDVSSQNTQNSQFNVAFISASSKLNDIQMRCRLIEQLFVNTLFDPEQSLAVSVLRFAKQQGESISIVIDHAHALSLQVKYELCQLVALAKKDKVTINIVLFGLMEAGQQLALNKTLFKSKVAIIDAGSGQILSLDDKRMIVEKSVSPLPLWQKVTLVSAIILIAAALIWVYLIIADDVNQQAYTVKDTRLSVDKKVLVKKPSTSKNLVEPTTTQLQKKQKIDAKESPIINTNAIVQATSEDINQLLTAANVDEYIEEIPAEVSDVLQALGVIADHGENEVANTEDDFNQSQPAVISNHYYQTKAEEYKDGYVVQISVFSDDILLQQFLKKHTKEGFYSYKRLLKGNMLTVITSKVFQNKAAAKAAIELLPSQLIERKPWVKSILSVINEMNTFTG
jgi:DamX protein